MVGAAKRALAAVITPGLLSENDFVTFVVVAEGLLNTRPLGYVSGDGDDLEPLTPDRFLIGKTSGDFAPHEVADWSLATKLEKLEATQNHFWRRLVSEMTPNFHKMNKWTKGKDNLEVGDIVATTDTRVRGQWPLAKIVDVHPDRDGIVRQVSVLQRGEVLRRHVGQLLLLVPAH
jgi:hypothetical protein